MNEQAISVIDAAYIAPQARVLVIDDTDSKRYAIKRPLEKAGFAVAEATTAADGLRLARQRPDVIVLDVKLPDASGFDVCHQLKEDPSTSEIPILHVSASFIGAAARVQGLESGADAYLTEPYSREELVAQVRVLLRLKRAIDELRASEFRLRLLGDNLPDSAVYQYTHDPDGTARYLYISAGVEPLNGVSVEDVLRDAGTLHRQIPPEYYARVLESERHSRETLSDFEIEIPMRRSDGQLRWMRLKARPRRTESGQIIWDGVQTDVTARKMTEQRLAVEHQITSILAGEASIDDTLYEVLRAIREGLGIDYCGLWMPSDTDHAFHCAAFVATDDLPEMSPFLASSANMSFKPGVGLPGKIWQTGRGLWLERLTGDANFPRFAAARRAGLKTGVGFPLAGDGRMLGVIEWFARESLACDTNLLAMFESLGAAIGQYLLRREAETRLRESELHLRYTIEMNPQVPWTARPDGYLETFSSRWLEMTGLSREQVVGEGWLQSVLPQDLPLVRQAMRRSLSCGAVYEVKYRIRMADGSMRWMASRANPRRNENGEIVLWYGTTEDIHERELAAQALQESESKYRFLVENTTDAVFRVGLRQPLSLELPVDRQVDWIFEHAYIVSVNAGFAKTYGYSHAEEVAGIPLTTFVPRTPDNEALVRSIVENQHRIKEAQSDELDRFGRRKVMLTSIIGHIENGIVTEYFGTSQDITQQVAAETALRESQDRLKYALQAAKMSAFEWNIAFDEVHRIASSESILPSTEADHPWKFEEVLRLVHPSDQGKFLSNIERALAGPPGDYASEFRYIDDSGNVRWLSDIGRVSFDAERRPQRLTGVSFDVTARRQVEEDLRERNVFLTTLTQASARLLTRDAIDNELLKSILLEVGGSLGLEMVLFYEAEASAQTLRLIAAEGLSSTMCARFAHIEFGQYLSGRVAHSRQTLVVENLEHSDFPEAGELAAAGVRCYFGIPLVSRGVVLGTVAFATCNRTHLRESELALLESICGQIASQLGRARGDALLRESQQRLQFALDAAFMLGFEWDVINDEVRRNFSVDPLLPPTEYDRPWTFEQVVSVIYPDDQAHFRASVQAALESSDGQYTCEYRLNTDSGTVRWQYERGQVEFDDQHRPLKLTGLSQDITARKEVELALRANETKLRIAIDIAQLATYTWNPITNDLNWDERLKAMFGLAPDAYVDVDTWYQAVHADDRARLAAAAARAVDPTGDGIYEADYRAIGVQDGVMRWVSVRGQTVFARGKAVGFYGTALDITERKKAEAYLERYRLLSENSRDILLYILLETGHIVEANAAAEASYGYTRDELLNLNITEIRDPSSHSQIAEQLRTANEKGILFETVHRRRDGHTFPVEVSSRGGDIEGQRMLLSIIRDISHRKQAEAQLRESEENFRAMFEVASVGKAQADPYTGRLLRVNKAFCDLTGYSQEELLQKTIQDVTHPEDRDLDNERFQQMVRGEATAYESEKRYVRSEGSSVWIRADANLIRDAEGNPLRIAAVIQDITARKLAEQSLFQREQQLRFIADHVPLQIIHCDVDLRYRFVNAAYAERFGRSAEKIVGMKIPELVGLSALNTFREHVEVVLRGERVEFEQEFLHESGTRCFHCMYVPELARDGQVIGFVGVIQDVTVRYLAVKALRESEEHLATEVEELKRLHSLNARLLQQDDVETVLDEVLRAAAELLNINKATAQLCDPHSQVLNVMRCLGFDRETMEQHLRVQAHDRTTCAKVLRTGQRVIAEDLRASDEFVDVTVRLAAYGVRAATSIPLVDSHGHITAIFTVYFDQPYRPTDRELRILDLYAYIVSRHVERKQAQQVLESLNSQLERTVEQRTQALREREERLRAILGTAADAIITISYEGKIIDANHATERMFGFSQSELIGKPVGVLMPANMSQRHEDYLARYMRSSEAGQMGFGREMIGQRNDGTLFPIQVAVSKVEHLNLFTAIVRDITLQRDLQRQVLEIANDEQRRIGQELHDGTQQELTGLSLVASTLVTLLDDLPNPLPEDNSRVTLSKTGIERIREIARNLTTGLVKSNRHVQQLSHGIMPVQIDAEGLRSALEELANETFFFHQQTECLFETSSEVKVRDNTSATHLYRIAQEAVNNALRHSQANEIRIVLEQRDRDIVLEVIDNGIGLPAAAKVRSASLNEGKGFGMKIMDYRARMIGGNLQILTRSEGGTVVRCTIPVRSTG